ncbi:uncharacterized protein LOC143452924 isoform X2 [Clavelina lepadiformis]|uniref:uncharacterized protein LOC143452924 isoform X2 n=1 Tax=Clavelina lepadiformis TaxID=159417 RepID=UPI0040424C08
MYHERNNIYPSLSWTYLKERTSNLFTAGKTYETAYNNMKHKMDDLNLASQFTKKTVNVDLTKSKRNLIDELEDLKTEKRLYVKSLERIDKTMMTEQQEIKHLIPEIIRTSKQETARKQRKIFIDLIGATVGLATGIVTKGPGSVYSSSATIFHEFDKTLSCPIPTIDEVRSTLQIRLNFASAYGRGNVDFSAMNVSAVPIIMRSELGKNKVKLTDEIGCLLRRKHGRKVKSLSNILNDFFRNGGLRITLINKIINLDLHIKKVSHKLEVATKWKNDINTAMHSLTHSIPMSIRRKFTEMTLSLYQDHEIAIKRSLYELAKAYQFMSLRKFETFKNYDNTYGDWQIKQTLDDERNRFLKALSTTAGSSSHTYTLFREFDSVTHPSLMTLFRKKGRVTVHLDLNPNNITTTGCVSCYNARLMSIYVEINGSAQPEAVPFRIYVKVAHMGDSNFLLPLSDGNKTVINFQQKPEDVAGGHVVHFNRKQLVTSLLDPLLQNKFKPSEGNRFCHDYNRVQDFFGGQLCKSPYATYTITVPRRRRLPCHRHVSGTNCQDLDFTRFEKLRMFLKIKAWSNYPIPPN